MQTQNRFFEDLSKFLNGAAGTVAGMGREAEQTARARAKEWLGNDLVTREEFEAVKTMAAKARAEADLLKLRLDALEGKKPAAKAAAPKAAAAKPAARKAPAKKPAAKKPVAKK